MNQDLSAKAKKIIKKVSYMKFYDASRPLYLEPDTSSVGLGARILQVRDAMNCGCDEVLDNVTL